MQNSNYFKKRFIPALVVPLAAGLSANVHAQQAGVRSMLEEVVVTAQRKEESLQDTPIAVSAFGVQDLERMAITDLTDLGDLVPSLAVTPFAGDRASPILFIRGMGVVNIQTTQDSAVGLYIDGVPIGRASGLANDIAELERIEVLRGPQGTLYGRNTTGGAINFVTRKPHDQFGFSQTVNLGNFDYRSSKTTVNLPVSDKLLTKFAYLYSEKDGWLDNNGPGSVDYYQERDKAGQFSLRYLPTDNLTVDYSYDFSSMRYGNAFYQVTGGQKVDRVESTDQAFGLSPSDAEISGHALTLTLERDYATFKSITSYRDLETDVFQNYIGLFYQNSLTDQDQVSQEFQVIGQVGDRFDYTAGLFYYRETSDEFGYSEFGFLPSPDIWRVEAEAKSLAVYGQGTWRPPVLDDRLELTLGLRYTEDEREAEKWFISNLFTGELIPPIYLKGDNDWSNLNPTVTFDYAVNDNVNSYLRIASGYRAGGYNTRSTEEGFPLGFDEEEVLSYEWGVKSQLFDNRLRLNAAAYYNSYEDLQISQFRPGIVFTDIINAGEATVKGAELELTALLGSRLTASMSYAYMDANYKEYVDNNVDLADDRTVPHTPRHSGRVALQYDLPSPSYGDYSLHVEMRAKGKSFSGPRPKDFNESYELINARLALENISVGNGQLRVALWGKNITDEEYTTLTTNFGEPNIASVYGTPRTYGVEATYEF